jgi:hypothetical protein
MRLAGGPVSLARDVPLTVGPEPLSPSRLLIARALLAMRPSRRDFQLSMTSEEAARAIDAAFKAEIAKRLAPVKPDDWPLSLKIHLADDAARVGILVSIRSAYNLAPGWTQNKKISGAVKNAVWKTLSEALPAVLPVADFDYVFEQTAAYHWDCATTDDEARAACVEYGGNPDDMLLPSQLRAAEPAWIRRTYSRNAPLPAAIRDAIAQTRRALRAFKRHKHKTSAWIPDYEIATTYEAGYDESSPTPPLYLVPLEPEILDALDGVADQGMQVGFFDVTGAVELTKPSQVRAWLDSLAVGARLLAALAVLLNASPVRKSP